jgi:hypothetical protein
MLRFFHESMLWLAFGLTIGASAYFNVLAGLGVALLGAGWLLLKSFRREGPP